MHAAACALRLADTAGWGKHLLCCIYCVRFSRPDFLFVFVIFFLCCVKLDSTKNFGVEFYSYFMFCSTAPQAENTLGIVVSSSVIFKINSNAGIHFIITEKY